MTSNDVQHRWHQAHTHTTSIQRGPLLRLQRQHEIPGMLPRLFGSDSFLSPQASLFVTVKCSEPNRNGSVQVSGSHAEVLQMMASTQNGVGRLTTSRFAGSGQMPTCGSDWLQTVQRQTGQQHHRHNRLGHLHMVSPTPGPVSGHPVARRDPW